MLLIFMLFACENKTSVKQLSDAEILHQNQDELTQIIIYDVFSPPVASRIYAYSSLAAYEAIRFAKPGYSSFVSQLNGFKNLPKPQKDKEYNYTLAATQAFFTVVHKVVFSLDSLKPHENRVYNQFKNSLSEDVYNRSVAFGDTISKIILKRAAADHYKQTRGYPKFLGEETDGKWRPTPSDYFDGVEAYWGTIKPLTLDSSSLADAVVPKIPLYNMTPKSQYYQMVDSLYRLSKNLSKEQTEIATYWDDNPFVMKHSGHMVFANKKITPGGHWMGIAAIASKQTNADIVKTAQTYAATAVALFDGFIECWNLKYKLKTVRPVTVINDHIDNQWQPLLETPPFPEYPSGHSTITRAAANVLTKLYGNNFSFTDTSDLRYIGMKRKFTSFKQAADEASISRVYGGIHFKFSVDDGAKQGAKVGNNVIQKLGL